MILPGLWGTGALVAPIFQLRRLRPETRRTAPWVAWWKAVDRIPPESPHASSPPLTAAPVLVHVVPDSANQSHEWE